MEATIEPKLTPFDRAVLRAVPNGSTEPALRPSQVRMRLRMDRRPDQAELSATLLGLEHLGYVQSRCPSPAKRMFWLTEKGAAAVRAGTSSARL